MSKAGSRYAVVVQLDSLPLSTWLVAPTSTSARAASFRPEMDIDGRTTRVLVEQTTAVDPQRSGEASGHLTLEELRQVDTADTTPCGVRPPSTGPAALSRRQREVAGRGECCARPPHLPLPGEGVPLGQHLRFAVERAREATEGASSLERGEQSVPQRPRAK